MLKRLTYYAIKNGKPAFANEASKSLPLHLRVYYHLLAVEKYMDIMGIEYERNFQMNPQDIKRVIDNDIYISFYNGKIYLPLERIRSRINYFPLKKDAKIDFQASSPVMAVLGEKKAFSIHYGNRRLTKIVPQYFEYDEGKGCIKVNIDGKKHDIEFGTLVKVSNYFNVAKGSGYRVNVIGYVNKKHKDESGLNIRKKYMLKNFSIDKRGKIFRVEMYKDDQFAGMFLVEFDKNKKLDSFSLAQTTTFDTEKRN